MSLATGRKVALITGGSQGIGAATARALANKGYRVAIDYSSNSEKAEALVRDLGDQNAICIKADASKIPEIERMVAETVQKYGKIDAVITAAARLGLQELADTVEGGFDDLFALNVKGPFFLAQCHASTVTPPYLLYNMTKGAVEQMTRVLAKDLGRKGINVNAVAPGPTATDMFLTGKTPQVLEMLSGLNPHKRIAEPEEIAEVIAFLTESRWVNGQVVRANGGMA